MFKTVEKYHFEWGGESWVRQDLARHTEREQRPVLLVTTSDGVVTDWKVEDAPWPEGSSRADAQRIYSFWSAVRNKVDSCRVLPDPEAF